MSVRTEFISATGHEGTFWSIGNTIERFVQPRVLLKLARIVTNVDSTVGAGGCIRFVRSLC